jgi:hypothetical protein
MRNESNAAWREAGEVSPPAHVHKWGKWEVDLLRRYKRRYCACGSFQARPVVKP